MIGNVELPQCKLVKHAPPDARCNMPDGTESTMDWVEMTSGDCRDMSVESYSISQTK